MASKPVSRFLISGLPRSRTAWFAVATGALHEPLSRFGYWPIGVQGISDSGAAIHLKRILTEGVGPANEPPRTLIIERERAKVMQSLRRYVGGLPMDWSKVDAYLDQALRGLAVESELIRRVSFDSLADVEVVRDCLAWLEVKEPPQLEQLMTFRVESMLSHNLQLLQSRAA